MLKRNSDRSVLILGIKFSEFIGIAGFAIACLTGAFTLIQWFQGPKIKFSGPRLVGIECDDVEKNCDGIYRCTSNSILTIRASTLAYVNTASDSYNAIINNERVVVKFYSGKKELKSIKLNFQYFSDQTRFSTKEETAKPFVVKGASGVANETLFFPWNRRCKDSNHIGSICDQRQDFLEWTEFLNLFSKKNKKSRITKINFKFVSTEQGGGLFGNNKEHIDNCFIDVTDTNGEKNYATEGIKIYQKTFVCHR